MHDQRQQCRGNIQAALFWSLEAVLGPRGKACTMRHRNVTCTSAMLVNDPPAGTASYSRALLSAAHLLKIFI